MDEHWRHQRDASIVQLETLIRRGRQITETRAVDAIRVWQQACAELVNQLSGGSKSHWLSRAYSNALLVRSASGAVVVEADAMEIVERIIGILNEGATSLSRMDGGESSGAAPRPRQFEFVRDEKIRPVLEQAFADSRAALERRDFVQALILSCSIIEALLTNALDVPNDLPPKSDLPPKGGSYNDLSFEERIATAERAGLIRGGCARLPPVARRYRELTDADGELRSDAQVSEREARIAGQVLRVVMRDLDPGR
jgi:hypothetical protein